MAPGRGELVSPAPGARLLCSFVGAAQVHPRESPVLIRLPRLLSKKRSKGPGKNRELFLLGP